MTVAFTITSTTTPATALASRLEFLLTTGRAGVAFDTAAGFTSAPGGAPFAGEIAPSAIEGPPTTVEVTGGGGGGGGLSGGAIAGIVVGSVVGTAALVALVVIVATKARGGEGKGGQANVRSESKGNKGVPVMNPESHQRRVVEGEHTSVTGRGGIQK